MNKHIFILTLIIGFALNVRIVYSDQPNGEPWSTDPRMEVAHEKVEYILEWTDDQIESFPYEESVKEYLRNSAEDQSAESHGELDETEGEEDEEEYEWHEIYHEWFCPFC